MAKKIQNNNPTIDHITQINDRISQLVDQNKTIISRDKMNIVTHENKKIKEQLKRIKILLTLSTKVMSNKENIIDKLKDIFQIL